MSNKQHVTLHTLHGVQVVGGSNPLAPTINSSSYESVRFGPPPRGTHWGKQPQVRRVFCFGLTKTQQSSPLSVDATFPDVRIHCSAGLAISIDRGLPQIGVPLLQASHWLERLWGLETELRKNRADYSVATNLNGD